MIAFSEFLFSVGCALQSDNLPMQAKFITRPGISSSLTELLRRRKLFAVIY